MNNAEIQIQFSQLGQWGDFTLTAIYQDAEGYTHTDRYTQDEIPAEQAPAMQAVVAALAGLAEPWQASQVWARLMEFSAPEADDPMRTVETVALTIEAVNSQRGRRIFTSAQYQEFTITNPAAAAFFKHFTTPNS